MTVTTAGLAAQEMPGCWSPGSSGKIREDSRAGDRSGLLYFCSCDQIRGRGLYEKGGPDIAEDCSNTWESEAGGSRLDQGQPASLHNEFQAGQGYAMRLCLTQQKTKEKRPGAEAQLLGELAAQLAQCLELS